VVRDGEGTIATLQATEVACLSDVPFQLTQYPVLQDELLPLLNMFVTVLTQVTLQPVTAAAPAAGAVSARAQGGDQNSQSVEESVAQLALQTLETRVITALYSFLSSDVVVDAFVQQCIKQSGSGATDSLHHIYRVACTHTPPLPGSTAAMEDRLQSSLLELLRRARIPSRIMLTLRLHDGVNSVSVDNAKLTVTASDTWVGGRLGMPDSKPSGAAKPTVGATDAPADAAAAPTAVPDVPKVLNLVGTGAGATLDLSKWAVTVFVAVSL